MFSCPFISLWISGKFAIKVQIKGYCRNISTMVQKNNFFNGSEIQTCTHRTNRCALRREMWDWWETQSGASHHQGVCALLKCIYTVPMRWHHSSWQYTLWTWTSHPRVTKPNPHRLSYWNICFLHNWICSAQLNETDSRWSQKSSAVGGVEGRGEWSAGHLTSSYGSLLPPNTLI